MILKKKKLLLITSLLTLLPIVVGLLLWEQFPEQMVTHWGLTGQPDSWSSVPFAVLFPPLLMLAAQWLCIWFTAKDPGNREKNGKIQTLVLWIIPILSNVSSYMMFALALGAEFSVEKVLIVPLGLIFALIGNYLPKCRKNSTIGIRIPWTFSSDENWNATHRLAGRIWVIGGAAIALSAFLPAFWSAWVMVGAMVVLVAVPMVYSYRFFRREKAAGKVLNLSQPPMNRKTKLTSAVFLIILLVFVLAVLFRGEIDYVFYDDYFLVDTNMYTDHVLFYDVIETVAFREENIPGVQVGGYGSLRLLMGYFRNEEFGTHIRYTYYRPEACVVATTKNETFVFSGENREETWELYQQLLEKCQ